MVAEVAYWDTELVGYTIGRKLRTSTIFARMENDAVFGQAMGYERPLYFHKGSLLDGEDEAKWYTRGPSGSSTASDCTISQSSVYTQCSLFSQ